MRRMTHACGLGNITKLKREPTIGLERVYVLPPFFTFGRTGEWKRS